MPLAQYIQNAVVESVKDTPLGPDDVRGFSGVLREHGVFISRMGSHNGHVPIGAVNVEGRALVNVFQARVP